MRFTHNQWAAIAITVTMCLAGMYTIAGSAMSTLDSAGFDGAGDDVIAPEGETQKIAEDADEDGVSDRMERTQYGTDPYQKDTDGDGLDDGWEIEHGLDPLDNGDAEFSEITGNQNNDVNENDNSETNETFPDPDNGPHGDPDRDGLINEMEAVLGTNPNLRDSDGDGLNDAWEAAHADDVVGADGTAFTLMDPLNANWDCSLLTPEKKAEVQAALGDDEWNLLADPYGRHSCDAVLDVDTAGADSLPNYIEERYGTDPWEEDSDGDLIGDDIEISFGDTLLHTYCGLPQLDPPTLPAPFTHMIESADDASWFTEDMDNDGRLNGPGDWDTDGDGMPDGFEFCYRDILDAGNSSDAFGDADEDGLNNVEEYQVAYAWGPANFTNPASADTDGDDMPDGWEASNGLHPVDGSNGDEDPDRDGWDADGDGKVMLTDLTGFARVHAVNVEVMDWVEANETVAWAQITMAGGNRQNVPLAAPVSGYVYEIPALDLLEGNPQDNEVTSRSYVWMTIVEPGEMFTNLMEYNARDVDGDGIADGRSTDPLDPDTDGDGLKDGIEVMGWEIRVVERGVRQVRVTSDPGLFDTDADGLNDSREFYVTYTNASNKDTDGDGLEDYTEAVDGFLWWGETYFTNASMFDTDNDGLEDGEEIEMGADQYVTHANNSDTDNDTLKDGHEVLYIPRPFQAATNPLLNDTDGDGMLDGWEMQVESTQDNTNSHSLFVASTNWLPPGCDDMVVCGKGPGGWIFTNSVQGFANSGDRDGDGNPDPKYFIHEMNLTGFTLPATGGRWALDPALGSLADANFDIDNDTLSNSMEAPDRWDTNPVDDDTDGDRLADGWEVHWSGIAIEMGLTDEASLEQHGARGPMDPSMIDSDLDGIEDGEEDFDNDGLNRSGLISKYCPGYNDPTNFNCHIDPDSAAGSIFYNDLENYTNYEELVNGTSPVLNDTDGDDLNDGPEVYYQDHDDDGMWTGWEYYFDFDPFDAADAGIDSDGDGYTNKCECEWNTNPKDSTSFPGQGQHCDNFE